MLDNRYTVPADACSLVGALGRNTLRSLADADPFRVRWSDTILEGTERGTTGSSTRSARAFADRCSRS